MMQRQSPPKHRHDGTSPLPLGMDWSPPPRKWSGRDTNWPHNPRTGWSYCVTIPAWVIRPKSRDSDPVVFYRVQVGLQSPEAITTMRIVLRRFNDFLKLYAVLKKAFPKKNLPPAPPKGLLPLKTRGLLDERRYALEEWMSKLLSDIDLSRTAAVASFLELEAAARFSFQNENQSTSVVNPSVNGTISPLEVHPNTSLSIVTSNSDYGSDIAYETSDVGTPSLGQDNNSEVGTEDLSLDEDLTSPLEKIMKYGMSNIDEGLFMGEVILERLEGFPKHKVHARENNNVMQNNINNGDASRASYSAGNRVELTPGTEYGMGIGHTRKLSIESVGSDISSIRGSESSLSGFPNLLDGVPSGLSGGADAVRTTEVLTNSELELARDEQLVLPLDQRHKMNRLLVAMQRRLITAKTDMEDLISRYNQEIAVKDYLSTKVKDLEEELETTKQKSKENLQQAILIERERFTQMQWDMEELRRKSLEMELKLKSQQDKTIYTEPPKVPTVQDRDTLLLELDASKKQLENIMKRHDELEKKSKGDIKVLVKEVKSLRTSQSELKQELSRSEKERAEAQILLEKERQSTEQAKATRRKFLHECEILCSRLQECNSFLAEREKELTKNSSSVTDALDLLRSSDNRVDFLLKEAQVFTNDDGDIITSTAAVDEDGAEEDEVKLRKVVLDIFTENAKLRKQLNSVTRCNLKLDNGKEDEEEAPSIKHEVNDDVAEK